MEVVGRMSRDKSSQSFIFVLFFYGFITEILTECFKITECFKVHHTLDEALQNPHSHTHTHTIFMQRSAIFKNICIYNCIEIDAQ